MNTSVRYERCQQIQLGVLPESQVGVTMPDPDMPQGTGNVLCTHDGVLLKKAIAEHIAELNTSGSLSLVEYTLPRRRLYLEWQPNDSIMVANDSQDQGDWALVDRISGRTRTSSECNAFNTKPVELGSNGNGGGLMATRARIMRALMDDLAAVEVGNRGQTIRFLRKSDSGVHCEFFFHNGNAELFLRSMRQQHFIESSETSRNGSEEYAILNTENQKLKKTFTELDIDEIKARQLPRESWLPHKLVSIFGTIPDYVQPSFQRSPKSRPNSLVHGDRQTSPDQHYQIIKMSGSTNSACSSNSHSRGESADKSPADAELDNLNAQDEKIVNNLPARQSVHRGQALNEKQWLEFRMDDGRISDSMRVKELIFRGGIVPSLRAEVWKYLLNYNQWSDTEQERIERRKQKSVEYYTMKAQWLSMTKTQESNFSGYRDRKCQIEKDVKRTDRSQEFYAGENNPNLELLQGILMTYVMYNFDLGYVQGMSDLLAPILENQVNEVDAFWCFVGFMDMVLGNFDMDQADMKTQFALIRRLLEVANAPLFNYLCSHDSDNMYFCFRWLLVWYKRELDNDDVLRLWECLWTRLPCANFHLLISVAILDQETNVIIDRKYEFTEILKHVNELTGAIDLKCTLETAEAIYLQLKASEALPNDIRHIIGQPLLPPAASEERNGSENDETTNSDDGFDELRELTPEEKRRNQMLLEEAYERSLILHHI
ncbi:TBC1 domain family member 15 [Drosophila grimshawi]|uniref:TBC1 domain family member 15 n=1 Tax=Drosophila grimshawi TaxID=7222 RepID=B4JBF1_DROGR|nr:TBC1 domain family member 15 [Drosophila grimshawi]EDW03974.1 GH11542 [Drosophila grimshawi]